MQFMLDHIAALMVFTAVAVMVAVTQARATNDALEQTIAYASKKQLLDLAGTLEDEVKLIGQGMPPNKQITSVTTNAQGETTSFKFWRNDGLQDLEIEYKLVFVDSVTTKNGTFATYRMDRYENSVVAGSSPSSLRTFRLEPLNAAGNIVNPNAARLVRISIINTYPMGDLDDMYVGQTHFGITLQPMNLN
jgi:hypothetical protein